MIKILRIFSILWLSMAAQSVWAQQEAMFTQYMHNEVTINPAYAGSHEVGSFTAFYRSQWSGIEGAPVTYSFNAHTPTNNGKTGLGLSLMNDKIGPTENFNLNGIYSYRISINASSHLQLGLQAGVNNFKLDHSRLQPKNPGDANFSEGSISSFSMNFGTGAYYFSNRFYAGVSVPKLLKSRTSYEGVLLAQQERHLFFTSGYVFQLSPDIKLKPSVLYKFTKASPMELDVTANLILRNILWVGAAWRSFDSVDLLLGLQAAKQLYIGYAYDFTTTQLADYNTGSHEILLNYRLDFSSKRILTPRYF